MRTRDDSNNSLLITADDAEIVLPRIKSGKLHAPNVTVFDTEELSNDQVCLLRECIENRKIETLVGGKINSKLLSLRKFETSARTMSVATGIGVTGVLFAASVLSAPYAVAFGVLTFCSAKVGAFVAVRKIPNTVSALCDIFYDSKPESLKAL